MVNVSFASGAGRSRGDQAEIEGDIGRYRGGQRLLRSRCAGGATPTLPLTLPLPLTLTLALARTLTLALALALTRTRCASAPRSPRACASPC